ncbi:hypothetical protein NQ314_003191 [Rhamnusium bicolor]|uniref:Amino acid permease/ SLC12A domain-containing protein n=1 Tax=Rhamnusium bicolor TaxID=1586634 RepID=A0AAV8ZPA1_9CUCU|nr:hypothetical protein NQ314_003191 [Rhamnusium bicolor]
MPLILMADIHLQLMDKNQNVCPFFRGTASVARGLSNYVDALADKKIRSALTDWMPMNISFLAPYPDFLSFGVVMLLTADVDNWKISVSEIPPENQADAGKGGFLPFGYAGIMAGAAKCFYGFVGFDAVATTGEEAKNPQRDIPLAIQIGWIAIKWIVTTGAVFALCTSLLGAMFPLPRVIYAMANDGVIFKPLAKVNTWTKTPLIATLLSGLFSGAMATIFDLDQLIDMMSIGTLLAYTIVSICVLVLRYEVVENAPYLGLQVKDNEKSFEQSLYNSFKEIFNLNNNKYPTSTTSNIVNWSIVLYSIFTGLFCASVIHGQSSIFTEPFYLIGFIISIVAMLVLLVIMYRQPVADVALSFKVGFLIYFFYGLSHSEENPKRKLTAPEPDKEDTNF